MSRNSGGSPLDRPGELPADPADHKGESAMADAAPGLTAAPGPGIPADDESHHWQAVAEIRRQHPRWVTIWVARARRYRAWPLFRAPRGPSLTAQTPEELAAQMNQIEQAARGPRGRSRGPGPS